MMSPTRSVPRWIRTVATTPRPRIELGLDHHALGITVGVGLELEDLGLELKDLDQLVEIGALGGADLDVQHVAAVLLEHHVVIEQGLLDALGIGIGPVDLVDRDHDRHPGRLGVIDRFDGLRHHAVVGGDHEDHDVGHLGAAGAHLGEGGVAGRVDEGHRPAGADVHLIGADMLRDAAGLVGRDIGAAQRVQERGLAVVDVAHDGDHGRARLDIRGDDPPSPSRPISTSASLTRLT